MLHQLDFFDLLFVMYRRSWAHCCLRESAHAVLTPMLEIFLIRRFVVIHETTRTWRRLRHATHMSHHRKCQQSARTREMEFHLSGENNAATSFNVTYWKHTIDGLPPTDISAVWRAQNFVLVFWYFVRTPEFAVPSLLGQNFRCLL